MPLDKTIVILAGSFAEYRFHLPEILKDLGGEWKIDRISSTATDAAGTRVIYPRDPLRLKGLGNWYLHYCGTSHQHPYFEEIRKMYEMHRAFYRGLGREK